MIDRPAGDAGSLVGRLYDTHGAALYRYAVMLLADPAAAEDAVQQVFASLLRQRGRISLDNEAHYLRRAVRNECYSARRRARFDALGDEHAPFLEPAGADVPAIEERITLETAVKALSIDQREVVHLHVFEGMTFQEIADTLGESINTISSRYRYALKNLREHLDR